MSSRTIHASLLRPAVIHILRAAGFHATRPSVLDALTDICARYMLLIATRTQTFAYDRTLSSVRDIQNDSDALGADLEHQIEPTIADLRNGLTSAAFFSHGLSASEEAWAEVMRKPLSAYPAGAREKERRRRDLEDTEDVREFIDWVTGPAAKEIRRVAGLLHDENQPAPASTALLPHASEQDSHKDDYLSALKKKQSKSGDSARYHGTILGRGTEDVKHIKIEGGPSSLSEWKASLKRKRSEVEQ